ncbi:MAG: diguanylate cyclase [Chloroflexi bacterium]|nr:diguanylate cyclase [Chloroflexota bacterium]
MLVLVSTWSFASFMIHTVDFPSPMFWFSIVFFSGVITTSLGVHFASEFPESSNQGQKAVITYYVLGAALIFAFFRGGIAESVKQAPGGLVEVVFGPLIPLAWTELVVGIALSIGLLIRTLKGTSEAGNKRRSLYPVFGFVVMLFGLLSNAVASAYPIDVAANIVFVGLLSYSIVKGQLLRPVGQEPRHLFIFVRVWLGGLLYSAAIVVLVQWLDLGILEAGIAAAALVLVLGLLFTPQPRRTLQKWAATLLFPSTFRYWDAVAKVEAVDARLSNWEDYVSHLVDVLVQTTHANSAVFYLLERNSGLFTPKVARGPQPEVLFNIKLANDSPIVAWLKERGDTIGERDIALQPQFKVLLETEQRLLSDYNLNLFSGIRVGRDLIGIVALGVNEYGRPFSSEDVDFCTLVGSRAASTIGKVLDYVEADERSRRGWLTGLYNHRSLQERLQEQVQHCLKQAEAFSLLMCDIDNFKAFNDLHGHQAGDAVLQAFGQNMKGMLRRSDSGYRYGGDEFICLLPLAGPFEARGAAERLQAGMSTVNLSGNEIPLTVGIGIASFPQDGVLREQILAASDTALRYAKSLGDGNIAAFAELPADHGLSSIFPRNDGHDHDLDSGALYALATAVEAKDAYTYGHSEAVARIAVTIGESLALSEAELRRIRAAGLLHDIGKIGIPDQILGKPGQLSNAEWATIHGHPGQGARIVRNIAGLAPIVPYILYHHERFDGRGYPEGLSHEDIPLGARIVCVADSYVAMISRRPYRAALTHEQSLHEIQLESGHQFDPKVVRVFIELFSQGKLPTF